MKNWCNTRKSYIFKNFQEIQDFAKNMEKA